MTSSPARGRAILIVLVLVIVACLAVTATVVLTRGAGDGIGDKLQSLKDDEAPAGDQVKDREELLALSREFATRFNTYDASMLDAEGHLPEYASVEELMTPKFGGVFADNVGYAEQTVAQLDASSAATVYAVGVASQDEDSAEVLVAGTIELSYPYPEDEGNGKGGDAGQSDGGADSEAEGEEDPRVSTGPQRFRYQLSLVKVDGRWLVDDLDDIDDGLPPFSQPGIPGEEQPPAPDPSASPTAPSEEPSEQGTEPTEEGTR